VSKVEKLNGRTASGTEVPEKPERRKFSAEYKARILREVDACKEPGVQGSLLRREGLYSSHLLVWRRQRDEGSLAALEPKKRGRKAAPRDPLVVENERLRRELAQVQHRLQQAEVIIAVQKKVAKLLGKPLPTDAENEENE
jgi:transposase-like protein